MAKKQHKVYVKAIGNKPHQRYRIEDETKGYWSGEDWTQDAAEALIFYKFQEAARDLRLVQQYDNLDKPTADYKATVTVTVVGESQMSVEELQDYLTKATRLSLTEPAPDEGIVQIQIHWDELKEVG